MATRRGTSNTNVRGNVSDRRARKLFLLNRDGDGVIAHCWECRAEVNYETMRADRKVPGYLGGTYRRNNIRIHCQGCSERSGGHIAAANRTARQGISA